MPRIWPWPVPPCWPSFKAPRVHSLYKSCPLLLASPVLNTPGQNLAGLHTTQRSNQTGVDASLLMCPSPAAVKKNAKLVDRKLKAGSVTLRAKYAPKPASEQG
jgi:hypothetical protein